MVDKTDRISVKSRCHGAALVRSSKKTPANNDERALRAGDGHLSSPLLLLLHLPLPPFFSRFVALNRPPFLPRAREENEEERKRRSEHHRNSLIPDILRAASKRCAAPLPRPLRRFSGIYNIYVYVLVRAPKENSLEFRSRVLAPINGAERELWSRCVSPPIKSPVLLFLYGACALKTSQVHGKYALDRFMDSTKRGKFKGKLSPYRNIL